MANFFYLLLFTLFFNNSSFAKLPLGPNQTRNVDVFFSKLEQELGGICIIEIGYFMGGSMSLICDPHSKKFSLVDQEEGKVQLQLKALYKLKELNYKLIGLNNNTNNDTILVTFSKE